jgi:hypothetical protein
MMGLFRVGLDAWLDGWALERFEGRMLNRIWMRRWWCRQDLLYR